MLKVIMKINIVNFLCVLLLSSLSNISWGLLADKNKSISIEANSAQMNDQQGVSIYSGHVVITQGSLQIMAEKVTAYHDKNGINKVIAEGSPAHYQQQSEKEGLVNADANAIHYFADQNKVILIGSAKLEQQGNTVQGQRITYDIQHKIGNAVSQSASGSNTKGDRVKMVFQPKQTTPTSSSESAVTTPTTPTPTSTTPPAEVSTP